ncbi:hypothetical protein TRAPUB_2854 [Trametes pubescens]|uniref:Uncharacterized protein n=1 Tax=Trametes pubescens TaxID=154538 RepID=A0A1M2VFB6_TRAPU|nr:hypothetical protein TRAPUB_2854 [Trametes pubescens]
MPPHRKPRRFLPTAAFYDKAGAIGSPLPSPTGSSFGDDAYTLTGYGELSSESAFMLPPSPTQTIKYRYRAYRPKLARLRKQRSSASKSSLKTKSSAYHPSDYASILNAYLSGTPGQSPKRDFRALLQKCRETAAEARQGERGGDAYATPRKAYADRPGPGGSSSRRAVAGSPLANW